jgi:hypothetical protein
MQPFTTLCSAEEVNYTKLCRYTDKPHAELSAALATLERKLF